MIAGVPTNYEAVVNKYVDDVSNGRVVVGSLVRQAVERHLSDLERIDTEGFRYYFDYEVANRMCEFFPQVLRHSTGAYAGQPFELYDFQAFVVWNIHGWRRTSDLKRRFSRAFYSVGRGNGKSPLGAGILMQCTNADIPIENAADGYSFATKQKQARIIFQECRRYVDKNDWLRKNVKNQQHNIFNPRSLSRIEPMSSEGKTSDGLLPHCVVCDELHEWRKEHEELYDKIETAMAKREQPLWLIITTAGTDESLIWLNEYNFARQVVEGNIVAENVFAFIAEIDDDDDELDERCWIKANPMLEHGVVKIEPLRELAAKATTNATKRHALRRYHCNKLTTSLNRPITSVLWKSCNEPMPSLKGAECFAGYDAGWRDDLAALGFVFPLDEIKVGDEVKRRYAIRADVWIPEHGRRNLAKSPWKEWIDEGLLFTTDGNTTDVQAIFNALRDRNEDYYIREMAYDKNNAMEFAIRSENEHGIPTHGFHQSTKAYNEPLREFVLALQEGRIIHGGNSLIGWCACNMAIKYDQAEYCMPVKLRSLDKIDPIVAIVMALGRAIIASRTLVLDYYADNDIEAI